MVHCNNCCLKSAKNLKQDHNILWSPMAVVVATISLPAWPRQEGEQGYSDCFLYFLAALAIFLHRSFSTQLALWTLFSSICSASLLSFK